MEQKKSDPLVKAFEFAQRAAEKAGERIDLTCALAAEYIDEHPDRVVMRLFDLFTEVAATYVLLHKALQFSARISGVNLRPLAEEKAKMLRNESDHSSHG